ncbi:MAG: ABC transporter permease [Candidatus Marinimicrobia bacterium]|nr:ABC transporter permease [Candidatus Neomarinimicrobiota bacterium]MBT6870253.1 ABC transporter permease [Candidatus Neomarinimicrobiota bacterium]
MFKIFTIIKKEMRDLVRDRRTMFFMIVFPAVILPLIIGGSTMLTTFVLKKEMDKILTVAIVGEEYDIELIRFLETQKKLILLMDLEAAVLQENILNESIDAAIVIPNSVQQNLRSHKSIELKLYFRSGKGENLKERRLNRILEGYFSPIQESRYLSLNLDKEVFEPYYITKIDVASEQEKFGKTIGTFLPYMFLLFCFSGAMYPALDLGAGEKERGTLETILTSPASQIEILTGKFVVVSIFGIMSVIFGLMGMLAAVKLNSDIPEEIVSIAMTILGAKPVVLILSLLIPIALFFASFLLSISFYAKTFKEAQSIMGPLNILIIFPIMIGLMPGITLNVSTAWVPILNVSLAMNDIISGTLSWPLYAEVMLSLLFFTGCSMWLSVKFVSREEVIFRG